MDMQMNESKNGGRTALGFLLTFFMTILLIVNALVIGIKTTVLSGSDVSEVLENLNIYEVLSELISSEISKGTSDENDDSTNNEGTDVSISEVIKIVSTEDVAIVAEEESSYNISDDAIKAIFGEDILKEITKSITDSIKNNKDVDLSGVKNQCMTNVEELSMKLVDDVIDEMETMSDDSISAESLNKLSSVQKMKNDYGVDVDSIITDYIKDNHGADTIKLADVDLESIRTDAKSTIKNDIMPELEKTMDSYILDVNESVNKSIREANENYNMSAIINDIEGGINALSITMITCIVLILLFAALQIVVYRKAMNRGFRNIFISTLISGIFTLIMALVVNVVKALMSSALGNDSDAVTVAVAKLFEDNIGAVGNRIMLIAIIYMVISVVCLVTSIIIKKKINNSTNDTDDNGMGTLSQGSTLA